MPFGVIKAGRRAIAVPAGQIEAHGREMLPRRRINNCHEGPSWNPESYRLCACLTRHRSIGRIPPLRLGAFATNALQAAGEMVWEPNAVWPAKSLRGFSRRS